MVQRLSNGTQSASLPAPAAVSGTPGFASDGNPATATQASTIDNDQWNQFQEELYLVATATGQTPSKTDNTQVFRGIGIVGTNMLVLTAATGSFTVAIPPGLAAGALIRTKITFCGGGGGGSAGISTQAGAGGAAGGFGFAYWDLVAGGTYTYTVGAGGAGGQPGVQGGASPGLSGGFNGGVTSLTSSTGTVLFSANGGSTGISSSAGSAGGSGAVAPTASGYVGGLFVTGGGDGTDGPPGGITFAGTGAAGPWGGSGRSGDNSPGQTLTPALAYGAGGGGTYGSNPGNAGGGAPGVIILES